MASLLISPIDGQHWAARPQPPVTVTTAVMTSLNADVLRTQNIALMRKDGKEGRNHGLANYQACKLMHSYPSYELYLLLWILPGDTSRSNQREYLEVKPLEKQ